MTSDFAFIRLLNEAAVASYGKFHGLVFAYNEKLSAQVKTFFGSLHPSKGRKMKNVACFPGLRKVMLSRLAK